MALTLRGVIIMTKATLTKEITVETANSLGIAAKLANLVSQQAKANIRAAWASGFNSKGHFSLITDNNQKVIEALKKEFPKTQEHEVVTLNVTNTIGQIEEVTNKISQAGLNIDYLYTTYLDDKPTIVISTDDNKKAVSLFNH